MSDCKHILGHWDDGCCGGLVEDGEDGLASHYYWLRTDGEVFVFCPKCGEKIDHSKYENIKEPKEAAAKPMSSIETLLVMEGGRIMQRAWTSPFASLLDICGSGVKINVVTHERHGKA